MTPDELRRFERKMVNDSASGCWLWMANKESRGYGKMFSAGRMFLAHRLAYEHYVGPIPVGLELDHLCRVTSCVNPAHLEAVTHAENCRRGDATLRPKTHCPAGHPYAGENLRFDSKGVRRCLTCRRDQDRIRMRATRAAARRLRVEDGWQVGNRDAHALIDAIEPDKLPGTGRADVGS